MASCFFPVFGSCPPATNSRPSGSTLWPAQKTSRGASNCACRMTPRPPVPGRHVGGAVDAGGALDVLEEQHVVVAQQGGVDGHATQVERRRPGAGPVVRVADDEPGGHRHRGDRQRRGQHGPPSQPSWVARNVHVPLPRSMTCAHRGRRARGADEERRRVDALGLPGDAHRRSRSAAPDSRPSSTSVAPDLHGRHTLAATACPIPVKGTPVSRTPGVPVGRTAVAGG